MNADPVARGLGARLLPPWMTAAPVALRRSSRRMTRASLFLLELLEAARRLYPEGPGLRQAHERAVRLSWAGENLCAMHGLRVEPRGPLPASPSILVANHVSYMDPVAITSLVPCSAVAKHEIGGWPLIGEALRTLGVAMVERGNAYSGFRVLRQSMRALEAGLSVLAFPEGTTSIGDDVLPMKRGMFGLARIAGAPIVPIAIRYDCREMAWVDDQQLVPHYLRTSSRRCTRASVTFGDPIDPRGWESAEALARHAREELRGLLAAAT